MITTTGSHKSVLPASLTLSEKLVEEAQAAAAIQTAVYAPGERDELVSQIKVLLQKQDAVLVAHYYLIDKLFEISGER